MDRLIFHIDVNSAFLSWEAARRVAEGMDDIRLVPSAVGGNPQKRTGVILAKSIPAKRFGIKTGEPVSMALRKCPDLLLAEPDFVLYNKCSGDFMDICRKYAPVVEKYSIDECFLDMSGTGMIYPDPVKTAYDIKNEIRDTLGFTVNVGIGNNKVLAKMASDFEKPDKVHTLFKTEIEKKMWPLYIRQLFTVGEATASRLEKAHIRTIGDLALSDITHIQSLIGVKAGTQLYNYANGTDESPVLSEPEEPKGYSISTTLEEDVKTMDIAFNILHALSDSISARMRADGTSACCIGVTIRSNDFKNKSHQKKLYEPTDITSEIFEISKELFCELWDGHTPLRLIGISLTDVTKGEAMQMQLFEDAHKEKERQIDKAVDEIRNRFGNDIIMRGSSLNSTIKVGRKYKAELENKKGGNI